MSWLSWNRTGYQMQDTCYRGSGAWALALASKLTVTDMKVGNTTASFWLGVIRGIVTLFVATIAGDFRDILGLFLLFLSLTTCGCGWSGISSSCGVRLFALSLTTLLLFLFPGLLKGLLGLRALFDRIGLIFGLQGLFITLIVSRIKTYLQGLFPFRASLI